MKPHIDPLVTRAQAAEILGVSLRTIDTLIAAGDIPVLRIGKAVRLRPEAIAFFIEARESRANPRAVSSLRRS